MHVFEVDDTKALWLALRADAHQVLEHIFPETSKKLVSRLEQNVYNHLVGGGVCFTQYHMQLYKEFLSRIRLASPDIQHKLIHDFETNLPILIKSYTSHISVFLHATQNKVEKYESKSKKLFYEVVRPRLMSLSADTKNELPACPTCKTNEFMGTIEIQTRSGDEAATVYAKCMKCQKILRDHVLNN